MKFTLLRDFSNRKISPRCANHILPKISKSTHPIPPSKKITVCCKPKNTLNTKKTPNRKFCRVSCAGLAETGVQVPPYSEVVPVDFEGGYYPIYGGEGVILGGCGGGIWYGGWYKRVWV